MVFICVRKPKFRNHKLILIFKELFYILSVVINYSSNNVIFVNRLQATISGTHMFCLDNSFSLISRKLVYFELFLRDATATGESSSPDAIETQNTIFDMKVTDFKVRLFLL